MNNDIDNNVDNDYNIIKNDIRQMELTALRHSVRERDVLAAKRHAARDKQWRENDKQEYHRLAQILEADRAAREEDRSALPKDGGKLFK